MNKVEYTGQLSHCYTFESLNRSWIIDIYKDNIEDGICGDIENNNRRFYFEVKNERITLYVRNPFDTMTYIREYNETFEELPLPKYIENTLKKLYISKTNNINYFTELEERCII